MSAKTPSVSAGYLFDPDGLTRPLRLDSPAWFGWLEAPTTTRFAYPLFDPTVGYSVGVMTVRKERRQRGGAYWTVYRRAGDRLCKVYLGRSATITQARLQAIADTLLAASRSRADPDQRRE